MASLSELYQSVILEHNRSPRNYRVMENADRHSPAGPSRPTRKPWASSPCSPGYRAFRPA
jgi:hypothetical protein